MVKEQQKEFQKEGISVEQNEVSILELRQQKAKTKSAFIKARRSLLVSLTDKELKTDRIVYLCDLLDDCQREAMDIMFQLGEKYKVQKDEKNYGKVCEEIEQIETECSSAQKRAQDIIENGLVGNLANQPVASQKSLHSHSKFVQREILQLASNCPMLSDGGQERLLPVDRLSRENSVSSESELIGQDLWKQLKRVTIPTFSGDKQAYQN